MCASVAGSTPQFFYQKANQLGKQAVYAAPIATGAVLAVAPFALYMFQPAGMLTQMLTLAATTGVVLNTPPIYKYVYNHPLTAKVCAQPIVQQICKHPTVQQGTAVVSSAIQTVSSFGSLVEHEVTSRLFPGAIPETYDEDDHEAKAALKQSSEEAKRPVKPGDVAAKSSLTNQLDTLKRAFKDVPTATAATLAVSAFALRFFQPEGIFTKFLTLTLASGAFFTGTKLYGRYHNHRTVKNLWKHPVVEQVSNHPVTQQGAALASQAVNKVSTFAKAAKAAYDRAFYPEAAVAPQRQERAPVTPELPTYPEFRRFLVLHGTDNWENVTFSEDQLKNLYEKFPRIFDELPLTTTKVREVTGHRRSVPDLRTVFNANDALSTSATTRRTLSSKKPSTDGSASAELRRQRSTQVEG